MTLPVRIVVRTSVDWRGMTRESFLHQTAECRPHYQLHQIARKVEALDAWQTARGNYFEYRGRVRDACEQHMLRELDVTRLPSRGWMSGPDCILVPVDDDDIIHPSVETLAPLFEDPSVGVVVWDRYTHHVDGSVDVAYPRRYFDSCNWAIRRSYLLQHWATCPVQFLNSHQFANAQFRKYWERGERTPLQFSKGLPGQLRMKPGAQVLSHASMRDVAARHSTYYSHHASLMFLLALPSVGAVEYLRGLPDHPMLGV